MVEHLLEDLGRLAERVWLVIDDLHELDCGQTLAQLESLVQRAPARLRFVLAARHDFGLGLHRLRLEGELTEIRAADLRFTAGEAGALFGAAGVELPGPVLALLVERTEGWAAGLRLAALSLARHPDPERFAAEFCGSHRMVADYLLAEVLERQPGQVQRFLLRTSILDRVNGELADLLTGEVGGERVLQDLEAAARSWSRWTCGGPGSGTTGCSRTCCSWSCGALTRPCSARCTARRRAGSPGTGTRWRRSGTPRRGGTGGWPSGCWPTTGSAWCWTGGAAPRGSSWPGSRPIWPPTRNWPRCAPTTSWTADRCRRPGGTWPWPGRARRRFRRPARAAGGDAGRAAAAAGPARRRPAGRGRRSPAAAAPDGPAGPSGQNLHALALISLGTAELWAARLDDAERHLEQGAALARRIGQPYLETDGLAHLALVTHFRSSPRSMEQAGQVIELAARHGWTDEPAVAVAYLVLGTALFWQGQLDEAESWLSRAEHALRADVEPPPILLRIVRGQLDLARGRDADALAAFLAAMPLADLLATPDPLVARMRARILQALIQLGEPPAPTASWPAWTPATVTPPRSASPRPRCASPRTTLRRRPPPSRPSLTSLSR